MSWLQTVGPYSFHKYNPDWKIVLCIIKQNSQDFKPNTYTRTYTGENYFSYLEVPWIEIREIDVLEYGLPKDAATVLATDLFRIKQLYENGGVYSDLDMIWLKPMESLPGVAMLTNGGDDFNATTCYYNWTFGHNNLSIMIAKKGSEYIKSILDEQKKIKAPYTDQIYSAELLNRMYPNFGLIPFKGMLALKYETFYPYSTFDLSPLFKDIDLKPIDNKNVMGIHWFAGNHLSNEYMHKEDFPDCTMTEILKREGYI